MRPLTGLDASFLYLESNRTPMHIGGVYILDRARSDPSFGYNRFVSHIESRLRRSMIFRERLAEVPMNLSHPYWINDPEFELEFHLPRTALPSPGGRTQLMQLAARQFALPLNRERPLWQMMFVEGLDDFPGVSEGSFAIIARVHHAVVDGMSGAELMSAILDPVMHPEPDESHDEWTPDHLPSAAEMIARAYWNLGSKALHLGKFTREVVTGLGRVYGIRKVEKINPPTLPMSAPRTILNRALRSRRSFDGLSVSLDRIKQLRQTLRTTPGLGLDKLTINDVVLAICSGGLRQYLESRNLLPDTSLVAMTPISVRPQSQRSSMGNQVSAMLVNLETANADVGQRLSHIHQNTRSSKVYSSALSAGQIAEFIPSETAALAARLYTRTRLGERHRPFFNLVITNVPGPQIPLYMGGGYVSEHLGTAPLIDGMGLMLVIFSYAGTLSIGITSSPEIIPDPDRLAGCFEQSLEQLETHADAVSAMAMASGDEAQQAEISQGPARQKSETGMETLSQALADLEQYIGEAS